MITNPAYIANMRQVSAFCNEIRVSELHCAKPWSELKQWNAVTICTFADDKNYCIKVLTCSNQSSLEFIKTLKVSIPNWTLDFNRMS